MADKVAGANESSEVGSATTSVDLDRSKLLRNEYIAGRDERRATNGRRAEDSMTLFLSFSDNAVANGG